ncbi:hypothetical protein GCM10029964_009600 [Kibdelosporangium lantanae]
MTVTAVGDPAQAIYGWRGASAANLPRFTTDFPREGLQPATKYGLLTSFRNPPEVLELANATSAPLRAAGLDVDELRAREDAGPGDVRCALLPDVQAELEWMADAVASRWTTAVETTGKPPTAAVLVRRRSDMADIATALRARGLPVEVVGLGGLLDEPEVRDLVSTLRVLVDPLAGTAATRLLTGSRWRVAAADLAALWRRATELAGLHASDVPDPLLGAVPAERAEQAGLVDALDDPGDPKRYSTLGYQRIRGLGGELTQLRRRLDQSLPELVADVERTMQLDIEASARPGPIARVHLDAFADVVSDYAAHSPSASLTSFLDYLTAAEDAEDGLEPGEVTVAEDRVQVLTVHSAKGLEWQVVAVPHVVVDVFPPKRRGSSWLRTVTELPAALRGDAADLPELRVSSDMNRKEVEEALTEHTEGFAERSLTEERRLFYVALTRSEHSLLVSGHWWGKTGSKPKGPSEFLAELPEVDKYIVDEWAPAPVEDEENPIANAARSAQWPVDPLGRRRQDVVDGAEQVRAEIALLRRGKPTAEDQLLLPLEDEDPDGWIRDTDVLLAERAEAMNKRVKVSLPGSCRSRSSWNWRRIRTRWRGGCVGRCRSRPTRLPGGERLSTRGWSAGSGPGGCWTWTSCRARRTTALSSTRSWTRCRRLSWPVRGLTGHRMRLRCPSRVTWTGWLCGGGWTRSSRMMTVGGRWSTGRPGGCRRRTSCPRWPCSWRPTGWPGPSCGTCPWSGSGRLSTTCGRTGRCGRRTCWTLTG